MSTMDKKKTTILPHNRKNENKRGKDRNEINEINA